MSTSSSPAHTPAPLGELPNHDDGTGEVHSDEGVKACLRDADELKQEGNDHFRSQRWNEALASYKSGLGRLPRRRQHVWADAKGKAKAEPPDIDEPTAQTQTTTEEKEARPVKPALTPLEVECAKARAILNANIGACLMKQNEYTEAVKACSDAILDDPDYVKAIQRRAQANEKIGSWSALSSAQEDYKKLLDILPPTASSQIDEVKRTLRVLQPRVEAAQKREMDEMIGKLKGVGNSILGNFGMSTDNFKFEPNGQGGYSMNFVR